MCFAELVFHYPAAGMELANMPLWCADVVSLIQKNKESKVWKESKTVKEVMTGTE